MASLPPHTRALFSHFMAELPQFTTISGQIPQIFNMKPLIATHNSCTSLPSATLLHSLLIPFARTQHLTPTAQLQAGCTYFDIRVTKHKGTYYIAHGLWRSSTTLKDLIASLARSQALLPSFTTIYLSITYEHRFPSSLDSNDFILDIKQILYSYTQFVITDINVKKPIWTNLYHSAINSLQIQQAFQPLDFSTWHSIIPIPYLWDRLLSRPHTFSDRHFTMVDFL